MGEKLVFFSSPRLGQQTPENWQTPENLTKPVLLMAPMGSAYGEQFKRQMKQEKLLTTNNGPDGNASLKQ